MKNIIALADFQNLSDKNLFDKVKTVLATLSDFDCCFVGGCVRDAFLENKITDFDIEVLGVDLDDLENILKKHFDIILTGKSFCVIKIKNYNIDVSVPRSEIKTGGKHDSFVVKQLKNCDIESAAFRRDFTINSIYFDIKNNKVIDPYNGIYDLENKILRHTGSNFSEDSLRVLRGMQFAGRFELHADNDTLKLCKALSPADLSEDRLFDEFKKLILKGVKPSFGLRFLNDCGWIKFFPEINDLIGCTQDSYYHPEGDVFEHTCMVIDEFAKNKQCDDKEDLIVGFACLCHDFGKPDVKRPKNGEQTDLSHADIGVEKTKSFLKKLKAPFWLIESVCSLVKYHMQPRNFVNNSKLISDVLHLANNCGNIERLVRLSKCDALGRKIWDAKYDSHAENLLLETARQLNVSVSKPKPLATGKLLLSLGFKPTQSFADILDKSFEAQLNCEITNTEEATSYILNPYNFN